MLAAAAAYPEDVFLLRSEAGTIHDDPFPFAFSPSMPLRTFLQGDESVYDGCMIFLDESVYMSYTYTIICAIVRKVLEDVNHCCLGLGFCLSCQDPGDAANLALECRLGTKMGKQGGK